MSRLSYEVVINGVDNGLIVRIGCKTLVFRDQDKDEFLADLTTYIKDGFVGERDMYRKYFGEEPKEACPPRREQDSQAYPEPTLDPCNVRLGERQ